MRSLLIAAAALIGLGISCASDLSSPVLEGPEVHQIPAGLYPPMARMAGVQGEMVLRGTIDQNGSVIDCAAMQGPPLIRIPAATWVRQWQFTPSNENGLRRFSVKVRYVLLSEGSERPSPSFPWCVYATRVAIDTTPSY